MDFRNDEGYMDPTAFAALSKVAHEEKLPVVYLASAYSEGDVEENVHRAQHFCRCAVRADVVPIAPHLLLPQFISEETERYIAMDINRVLLRRCDALWVCGRITAGMRQEIHWAKEIGKRIRFFNDDFEEVTRA